MAKERKLDGIGDRLVGFAKKTLQDIVRDVKQVGHEKWDLGVAEIQRAVYPESNIALQPATSQQQLLADYEQQLTAAHDRATEQPTEPDRAIER